jgi:multidrug transporter EmrE-like cation transporter
MVDGVILVGQALRQELRPGAAIWCDDNNGSLCLCCGNRPCRTSDVVRWGISSSVIPYVFDQLAMARLSRATYALFVALLPATAVIIGVLVLHQVPSMLELIGVARVALGVALHRQAE